MRDNEIPGMDGLCIRRQHARWSTCKCDPCRDERNRLRKKARNGLIRTQSRSDEAWAAVDRMHAAGWTDAAIASTAGITPRAMHAAMKHRRVRGKHRWTYNYAERIIAAERGQPTAGQVSALGARRRLQALSALGHSMYDIAAASGIHPTTVAVIRSGATERIRPGHDTAVREAYQQLSMIIPPPGRGASFARAHARRQGWSVPLAWDDDTIDDPDAKSKGTGRGQKANRVRSTEVDEVLLESLLLGGTLPRKPTRAERLEAVHRLHAQRLSYTQIAARLRITDRQICRDLTALKLTEREAS